MAIWAIATALRQSRELAGGGGNAAAADEGELAALLTTPQIVDGKRPERARLMITSATVSWPASGSPFDSK